jgi:hypothetical protein
MRTAAAASPGLGGPLGGAVGRCSLTGRGWPLAPQVRLALYPTAFGEPADAGGGPAPRCLFSKPVSTTHAAKYSRQQLVAFTAAADSYDCAWSVVTPDPAMRAAAEGVQVRGCGAAWKGSEAARLRAQETGVEAGRCLTGRPPQRCWGCGRAPPLGRHAVAVAAACAAGAQVAVGAPVLLIHAGTQKPLALEACRVPTDFGLELEVACRAAQGTGLKLAMEQMSTGVAKGFLPKGETSDAHWTFVGGEKVARLPPPRCAGQRPGGRAGGGQAGRTPGVARDVGVACVRAGGRRDCQWGAQAPVLSWRPCASCGPCSARSSGPREAASAVMVSLLMELAAKPGALPLLERKLVTLESADGMLSGEGKAARGSRAARTTAPDSCCASQTCGQRPYPRAEPSRPAAPNPPADFTLILRQVGSGLLDSDIALLLARYPAGPRGALLDSTALRGDLRGAAAAAGF